jgi:hypothetical protein
MNLSSSTRFKKESCVHAARSSSCTKYFLFFFIHFLVKGSMSPFFAVTTTKTSKKKAKKQHQYLYNILQARLCGSENIKGCETKIEKGASALYLKSGILYNCILVVVPKEMTTKEATRVKKENRAEIKVSKGSWCKRDGNYA